MMFRIEMKLCLLIVLQLGFCSSNLTKPKLTFDEYFEYSTFPSLSLSPNGQYLLIHTRRPAWDIDSFKNSLWLYETKRWRRKLITNKLSETIKPKWSPSGNWIVLLLNEKSTTTTTKHRHHDRYSSQSGPKPAQHIYLYCVVSDELLPVEIGTEIPSAITWSNKDSSLYVTTMTTKSRKEEDDFHEVEWKDVIQHRERKSSESTAIYRIDIDRTNRILTSTLTFVKKVSFRISELLFSPSEKKLVFTSTSEIYEDLGDFEIYSIDLRNVSSLSRLTNNEQLEHDLKLSRDGKQLLFQVTPYSSSNGNFTDTQRRLYSVHLTNGQVERLAKDFDGSITGYTTRSNGGVYILGQLGTNVQIYTQQSPSKYSFLNRGWNGTYESISSSSNRKHSIAFVYSSFGRPKEVYFIDNIDELKSAKIVTNENRLFTQRNLPQAKVYQWFNDEDHRTIEGILHYPPGKFECRNLPLFVLIHGGPYSASINQFRANINYWPSLAASEGWLVLEPNYRGSTGYGDQFLSEVRFHPLSRPGRDILAGVDRLIKDGIADPNNLVVGGYSYGGFLTNWLITQTTRFNAAVSGAGSTEHVSAWGIMDLPIHLNYLFGGFPWEVSHTYQNESSIYHLDKVRTPTHITTGENDVRVPADQSYILERGLYYLGIPVKLLIFPNEGHSLNKNPWHGKIKLREELKWLQKYGYKCSNTTKN